MKISIVIPVYNSEKTIYRLVESLVNKLSNYNLEIILVNDCSKDNSYDECLKASKKYNFITFLSLRKNFSEHNAVICGLNFSSGDYAVIIDDDFQNPPSEIANLIEHAISGNFDVVYSKYKKKQHSIFRNIGSNFNNYISSILLKKPKNLYLSSFKIIKKEIVFEIIKYKGPYPYIDGLILRVTNNFSSIYVDHNKRSEGESNYTFRKLISLYLNMFFNFSILPLRLFTFSGLILFFLSIILIVVAIIEKILNPTIDPGWTSIFIAIIFFSGIQLIFIGTMGEYIGKLYLDVNKTPQYVIQYNSRKDD